MMVQELKLLSPILRTNWNGALEALPESLSSYSFWQYSTDNHASSARRMLGSIFIYASLSDGSITNIRHVVIEGSSQWVVGRNVNFKCEIVHSNGNYLKLPNNLRIPIEDVHMHSFSPSYLFKNNTPNSSPSF